VECQTHCCNRAQDLLVLNFRSVKKGVLREFAYL